MRIYTTAALALGAMAMAACGGSTDDPETVSKSDLNPPSNLVTVTGDGSVELRWTAANVEDDFVGYYVFAKPHTGTDKYAPTIGGSYPSGVNIQNNGIPRCDDNSAFFESFGLPPTDEVDCEGNVVEGDDAADPTEASLTQDDGGEADDGGEDTPEVLTGWVKCTEANNDNLSLPASAPTLTTQRCTVATDKDGTALVNGTTYEFIVVAVAGDDRDKISWSSNIAIDSPSTSVIAQGTSVVIPARTFQTLKLDTTNPAATITPPAEADATSCSGSTACGLSSTNAITLDAPTIFLGRADVAVNSADPTDSYPQRIFISASNQGKLILQPRGAQTWDPLLQAKGPRIPGDIAAGTYPSAAGTKYIIYNNQVFDIQWESTSGDLYYGKIVIDDVTYEGDTTAAQVGSTATVSMTMVMQPGPNLRYYFKQ